MFTGTPSLPTGTTAVTQTTTDNSTAIATTAFVKAANATNANLTGPITSVGNATSIASQTGTGTTFVMNTSPTLVTPNLGVATATSVNKLTLTAPTTSATLTIADGKTLTANNSVTLEGTDATKMIFPSTDATLARTDAAQTFVGLQTFGTAGIAVKGSTSGTSTVVAPAVAGTTTITLPGISSTLATTTDVANVLDDASMTIGKSGSANGDGIRFANKRILFNKSDPIVCTTDVEKTTTAAEILESGIYINNPALDNDARTKIVLPAPSTIITAAGAKVGDVFSIFITVAPINNKTHTISLYTSAGNPGSSNNYSMLHSSITVAEGASRVVYFRVTNATSGSEAISIY